MKGRIFKKFGTAFGENLETGRNRRRVVAATDLQKADLWVGVNISRKVEVGDFKPSSWRVAVSYFLLSALGLVLLARAFDLQVIQGSNFLGKAQGNHIRVQVDHAPRGVIYDRSGVVLAQNKPGFRLLLDRKSMDQIRKNKVVDKLSSILELEPSQINQKIEGSESEQITISNDLSVDKALLIESEAEKLSGVALEINPTRFYPYKEVTS